MALLWLVSVPGAGAQRPDSTRTDSLARARADSARVADSLALVRELERAGPPPAASPAAAPAQGTGPINPKLLPDISLVGDLIFDASKRGSTQEDGQRFSVREIEVQIFAPVDPYFRGDVLFSYNDLEGVAVEQALVTTTSLPWHLEVGLGRFFLPFGKQNTTHREALLTLEYPWALQRLLSADGLKGSGLYASRVFAPFGFYQEVILTATERLGEVAEGLTPNEPTNQDLDGLGYTARLRNFWDLTPHANVELSASVGTGKVARPLEGVAEFNALNARHTLLGVDFTYRWRPLRQGLYKSFILQGELVHEFNDTPGLPPGVSLAQYGGPRRGFTGGYLFARYQIEQRAYLGLRGDLVEDPEREGRMLRAVSAYYQLFPSEFSKLVLGFERVMPRGAGGYNRLILQNTITLGPHRPHPF